MARASTAAAGPGGRCGDDLYLLVDVARPLRKLEDAVSRVGEDINRDPVPES